MKSRVTRVCYIIMTIIIIGIVLVIPDFHEAEAANKNESVVTDYLNVNSKYLYLGIEGKDTYELKINSKVKKEVVEHSWDVLEEKGDPKAVQIDEESGIVKAKRAGTAYIVCEITLADKTVVKAEAQIIVINNITGVRIKNIPANNVIGVGESYDFNEEIISTTAGEKAKSSGVTRWEVKDDTADVGIPSDDGVVIPRKAGKFSIRVVSFEKEQDYSMWLMNKKARSGKVTAASEWVTITVLASEGEAATQDQLKSLLSDENIRKITIPKGAEARIDIPQGDYSDKTLIVKASNVNIANYGTFKLIAFYSAFDIRWTDYGLNNEYELYDSIVRLDITDKAQIKSIKLGKVDDKIPYKKMTEQKVEIREDSLLHTFTAEAINASNNLVHVSVSGEIDRIDVTTASSLYLSGGGKIKQVILNETSKGARLATSMAANIETHTDSIITLLNGAEAAKLHLTDKAYTDVDNLTTTSVSVNIGDKNFTFMSSGYKYTLPYRDGIFGSYNKAIDCRIIKLYPSQPMNVTASSLLKGQKLWFSNLHGECYYNSINIPGILTWELPELEVVSTGYFRWKFTPLDTDRYATIYGYAEVTVHGYGM